MLSFDSWGRISDDSGLLGQDRVTSSLAGALSWGDGLIRGGWWIGVAVGYVLKAIGLVLWILCAVSWAIINFFVGVWNYLITIAHLFIDALGFFQRVVVALWDGALRPGFLWLATHVRTSLVVILGWLISTSAAIFSVVKANLVNLFVAIYDLTLPDVPEVDWGDGAGLVWLIGKFTGIQFAVPALVNVVSFAISLAVGYFTVALLLTICRMITGR